MSEIFTETIICLAMSRKNSGFCIAGKRLYEPGNRSWCRPISKQDTQEISEKNSLYYSNGKKAELLDIIEIVCIKPSPTDYQIENILIDEEFYWRRKDRAYWGMVLSCIDNEKSPLWKNGFGKFNDIVPYEKINKNDGSLRLIKLEKMTLNVILREEKLIVYAKFSYQETYYSLKVTDPVSENFFSKKGIGEYKIFSVVACISLTKPYENDDGEQVAHKLVASILTESRVLNGFF